MIKALFFGPVAESIGFRSIDVEYRADLRLETLCEQLALQYPEAFKNVSFIALNGVQVRDLSQQIPDSSEIAFMAKFSGG